MGDPLADCHAKLGRAKTHLDSLMAQLGPWVATHQQLPLVSSRSGHYDEQERALVFGLPRLPSVADDLPDLPLVAGDALHNFRGVLDYLAWVFVSRGDDPQPDRPQLVGFPIYFEPSPKGKAPADRFVASLADSLPGVAQRHIDVIEWAQPYNGIVSYDPIFDDPALHPLSLLSVLSNRDKHRRLQVMTWSLQGLTFRGHAGVHVIRDFEYREELSIGANMGKAGQFDPSTIEIRVGGTVTGPDPEVAVDLVFPPAVRFAETGGGVEETLNDIGFTIAVILERAASVL